MKDIGGNTSGSIQTMTTSKNKIGENVKAWNTSVQLNGWIDLSNETTKYSSYNAKVQESTHVFISDYVDLKVIRPENSRMIINGKTYDIMLIDDPMEMHVQLEIYLKYTGGIENGS